MSEALSPEDVKRAKEAIQVLSSLSNVLPSTSREVAGPLAGPSHVAPRPQIGGEVIPPKL